jgi:Undecaprenyl-phosphate glucose phosphotransferase
MERRPRWLKRDSGGEKKMSIETSFRAVARLPAIAEARTSRAFWTAMVILVELIMIALCVHGAFLAQNMFAQNAILPDSPAYTWASVAAPCLYVLLCLADNQYDFLGPEWNERNHWRGATALVSAFVLLLIVGYVGGALGAYSPGAFLMQLTAALLGQIATRAVLWQVIDHVRTRGHWQCEKLVVLVFPGAGGMADVRETLSFRQDQVVRYYHLPSGDDRSIGDVAYDAQLAVIRRECRNLNVDAVLVLFGADQMASVRKAVSAVSELPVRIQLMPVEMMEYMRQSRVGTSGTLRVLELPRGPSSLRDRLVKRAFDNVAAIAMLAVLWPLLLIVAILIKIDSPGPVLFRQTRHGFNNEPIGVLKFRSMTTFDDSRDQFRQAVRNDSRITRVGRFIRRTNIDELPQLLNVLKGEMSMVGPRPHAVAHNEMFAGQIDRMHRRHIVKPGITGWAQVNGLRGETDTLEKMQLRIEHDLYYIDNWSFMLDVKILIMTVISKSAYSNAC